MPLNSQTPTDTITWPCELAPISNIAGQEAGVQIVERPPGGGNAAHYHPEGHEWVYCAAGRMMLTIGDAPAKEIKAGDVEYLPPGTVHFGRNLSQETVKLILFRVKPIGAPLTATV
jgi:quercetin dioxygenase-like cupin family protein